MSNNIIDLSVHIKRKEDANVLTQRIKSGGWEIEGKAKIDRSEACVYLLDSVEGATILFGCPLSSFQIAKSNQKSWGDFLLAWEIIANPDIGFDDEHKEATMKCSLQALPRLAEWKMFSKSLESASPGKTIHLIIIIDRDDNVKPVEFIVAFSYSPVMDTASINAILKNYQAQKI